MTVLRLAGTRLVLEQACFVGAARGMVVVSFAAN
jgi:hypothetical protein